MSDLLSDRLAAAYSARSELLPQLHAEGTNAYRLFHGSVEGRSGLTVDRYGDLLLVQSFHTPLEAGELADLEAFYAGVLPGLDCIYNDRSRANSRIANDLPPEKVEPAHRPRQFSELGVNYLIQARHAGQDPWLFLDLRAGRRRIMQDAVGKLIGLIQLNHVQGRLQMVWRQLADPALDGGAKQALMAEVQELQRQKNALTSRT